MRFLKLSTLFVVLVAFGLTIGATPQPALAQSAKKLKCTGCVKSKQLKNKGVKGQDIGDNAITGVKIAPGAVGGSDLAGNAVTGAKVQDGSLSADDLGNEAGAAVLNGLQFQTLNGSGQSLGTVTLSAPGTGIVVVMASGIVSITSNVVCSITTGTTVDFLGEILWFQTQSFMPWAGHRAFVVSAGSADYNFICNSTNGGSLNDIKMTAMYFPTQY